MTKKQETEKIKLTEQGLKNVRIELQDLEIKRDERKFYIEMSNYLIDNKVPTEIVTKRINELKEIIESGKDFDGKIIPESKKIELRALIKQLNLELKLDLPIRRERVKLSSYMNQEQTGSAINERIKDLKKAIRTGYLEVQKKEEIPSSVQ